jgi:hypothetical protein
MKIAFFLGSIALFVMAALFIKYPREAWNKILCLDYLSEGAIDVMGPLSRILKKITESSYPLWHMRIIGGFVMLVSLLLFYGVLFGK